MVMVCAIKLRHCFVLTSSLLRVIISDPIKNKYLKLEKQKLPIINLIYSMIQCKLIDDIIDVFIDVIINQTRLSI